MYKIIYTLVILFILTGCTTWHHTAYNISKEPYHAVSNNCTNKAYKFIALEGGEHWTVRTSAGAHAMVLYKGWWVDPTAGTWARDLTHDPIYSWD